MQTSPALYRFSCRYLRDAYLAQDALQETYVKALQHLDQLRDPQLLVAWLEQINMRICYRMQRKASSVQVMDDETMETLRPPAPIPDPEDEVVRIDLGRYMMRQILELPVTESKALLLRYYHDMKLEDIAAMLDVSLSTVKRSLRRGIARLEHALR